MSILINRRITSEEIMMVSKQKTSKEETIKLRINAQQKALIDRAAQIAGITRSAFVLNAALSDAEETIKDRTTFYLSDSEWVAFNEALDSPPQKNELITKLLNANTPW